MGREGAGDDFRIVFWLEFSAFYGKFLLKDYRVFVFRIAVAAKTKVAESVYDVAPVVFFDALKYMGMMAEYQRGSAVDGVAPEGFLLCVGVIFALDAPVKAYDNNFCFIFLCLYNS